jgi:aryl-alcohol dehydrogenase-like predicted oxidoreductase
MTFEGIALGCGNFGGVGSAPAFFGQGIVEDEAFAIMDRAWANGIHWFDTGDAYGGGASERWIGAWRADRRPEGLRLTTKVFHSTTGTPGDTGLAPDRIRRQLEGSLERLGVDRVDLYLAHEPDAAVPLGDTIAVFEAARDEGLIGAWGLSNYDDEGVAEALRHGTPALLQNPYSLLHRQRDRVPALRAAGRRLVDGQVPPRRVVSGRFAHDAATRTVQAVRLRHRLRWARPPARGGGLARLRHGDTGLRLGAGDSRCRRCRVRAEPCRAPEPGARGA